MSKLELPTWLPEYEPLPALYESGKLRKSPVGIVIHSGIISSSVAEYFNQNQESKERKVSAHFAWSKKLKAFAQCVPLDERACHVGFFVNRSHYGIEMPGPIPPPGLPRAPEQYEKLIELIKLLKEKVPTITELVAHSYLNKNKPDPGIGFEWERLINLGLKCKF